MDDLVGTHQISSLNDQVKCIELEGLEFWSEREMEMIFPVSVKLKAQV